jgi:hypothetical protein
LARALEEDQHGVRRGFSAARVPQSYDQESDISSREAMIAEMMSVVDPPPFV